MRGKVAKRLRRIATGPSGLNKAFYKALKAGKPLHEEAKAKPDKRRKPLPVAPRAGAKPMHLVRKIQEVRAEMDLPRMGYMVRRWGAMSRPYIQALLRDVTEQRDRDPSAELPEERLAA